MVVNTYGSGILEENTIEGKLSQDVNGIDLNKSAKIAFTMSIISLCLFFVPFIGLPLAIYSLKKSQEVIAKGYRWAMGNAGITIAKISITANIIMIIPELIFLF